MPDSATSLALRDKVELLAQAWLTLRRPAGAVWSPVEFKRRKELTDRAFPRVVIDSTRSPEDEAAEVVTRVECHLYLGTAADEVITGSTPQVAHTQRSGWIDEIFSYGAKPAILHYCNLATSEAVPATDLAVGMTYEIVTTGTTNFTTAGAAASTPGTIFVATAAATGTGTVKRGVARPLEGLFLYDIYPEDGNGNQTERHWIDELVFQAVCTLTAEP